MVHHRPFLMSSVLLVKFVSSQFINLIRFRGVWLSADRNGTLTVVRLYDHAPKTPTHAATPGMKERQSRGFSNVAILNGSLTAIHDTAAPDKPPFQFPNVRNGTG